MVHSLLTILGLTCLGVAIGYGVIALLAVLIWRLRTTEARTGFQPSATLLKPLCGAEPGLYEHLRSFCEQTYPEFQIVFGIQDAADEALPVAQRLKVEFPGLPIDIVIDPQLHGSSGKVSNLINMLPFARHDVLVMADSDTFVGADYLATVTAPLRESGVGLVTCVYHDVPTPGIWSRLGAMYINEWYMPSVLLAHLFGHASYASGQTLCLRRETLQAIGGFRALVNHLAEDYRLGELVRKAGLRIVLSPVEVMAEHHEPSLESQIRHELRWMKTIRVLRPRSFGAIFLSFTAPLALCGYLLAASEPSPSGVASALLLTACLARLGLHFGHRRRGAKGLLADLWLIPARDLLLVLIWIRSFFTFRVTWRGSDFDVDAHGIMHRSR